MNNEYFEVIVYHRFCDEFSKISYKANLSFVLAMLAHISFLLQDVYVRRYRFTASVRQSSFSRTRSLLSCFLVVSCECT